MKNIMKFFCSLAVAVAVTVCPMVLRAQSMITTIAGNGTIGYSGDGFAATAASFNYYLWGVHADPSGNVYVADYSNNVIRKIDASGIITTFAGTGSTGAFADGIPATDATINWPFDITTDAAGNVYFSDADNRIYKINTSGIISTFAGTGAFSSYGDGGPATAAGIDLPDGIVFDASGNMYVAEAGANKIRKINTSGIISTIAAVAGGVGYSTGVLATIATLNYPMFICVDASGNVIFSQYYNHCVSKIDMSTGMLNTIAGTAVSGYSGDGGLATNAKLHNPCGVKYDASGNLYIGDGGNYCARKVNTSGIISTIAGIPTVGGFSGDGGLPTLAKLGGPAGLTFDVSGNMIFTDAGNHRFRMISPCPGSPQIVDTIVCTSSVCPGATTTATDDSLGGLWSVSNGNATIGSSSGIVTGVSAGTVTISYTVINTCWATTVTTTINVLPLPAVITGPTIVCPGNTITLSDATSGGAWSSGNSGIATVASGVVTGVSAGNVVISYTSGGGCSSVILIAVGVPVITTIAGNGSSGYFGDNGPATAAKFNAPARMAMDGSGNLFIADDQNNRIRKVTPGGIITTVAGNGTAGYSSDGIPATNAELNNPADVAVDASGNIYIADVYNNRVRKVDPSGIITTIAGNGSGGFLGEGVPATAAQLYTPVSLALDGSGNLYIGDMGNQRIRKVNTTGIITTVAGNGLPGYIGDGGPATVARLQFIAGIGTDSSGNLYISDYASNIVRKVDNFGIISRFAGNLSGGLTGDGGPATAATLNQPVDVKSDVTGNIYICDGTNHVIRKINTSGIISTVVGNGTWGFSGDGGTATTAQLNQPVGVLLDANSNIYISDNNNERIRKVSPANATVASITGLSTVCKGSTIALTDVTAGGAWSSSNTSVATVGTSGIVTGVNAGSATISYSIVFGCGTVLATEAVTINPAPGIITGPSIVCPGNTITMSDAMSGGVWSSANSGIATVGSSGVVTGVSAGNAVISYTMGGGCAALAMVTVGSNIINTFAGNGTGGYIGDGMAATASEVNIPNGIKVDAFGNLYLAETDTRVRKINTSGIISTVAGTSTGSYTGDGGPATAATLFGPTDVNFDAAGNIYITDGYNNVIRKITISTGIITTVAGNGFLHGTFSGAYSGDNGQATAAELYYPNSVVIDSNNNIIFADQYNHRIRKVNASTGIITTIAGNGTAGYFGDGGAATLAKLNLPSYIALDGSGNLIICDHSNNVIRKVDANTSIITTIAGNGTAGFTGDGTPATSAELNGPEGVMVDVAGNIYISGNNRIRKINTSGIISTFAGNGTAGFGGDGGPATAAAMKPDVVCIDAAGNI